MRARKSINQPDMRTQALENQTMQGWVGTTLPGASQRSQMIKNPNIRYIHKFQALCCDQVPLKAGVDRSQFFLHRSLFFFGLSILLRFGIKVNIKKENIKCCENWLRYSTFSVEKHPNPRHNFVLCSGELVLLPSRLPFSGALWGKKSFSNSNSKYIFRPFFRFPPVIWCQPYFKLPTLFFQK